MRCYLAYVVIYLFSRSWFLRVVEIPNRVWMFHDLHTKKPRAINVLGGKTATVLASTSYMGLNLYRVKPITDKIGTYRCLAWCAALIGWGKDWLVQCQDNVTE